MSEHKENILELFKYGLTPNEIAEIRGVSHSYVCRVLRELSPKTLTPTNYVNAILSGLTTNEDIATFLNVNISTLKRYKSKHDLKIATAKYLYISGWTMERIKNTFHFTNAEAASLETLGTFEQIKDTLRRMQNALQPHSGECDQINGQLEIIERLLKDLKC